MQQRLSILFNANVINQETYDGCLAVVAKLKQDWALDINNDQGAMMITHLANAVMRVYNNVSIEALNQDVLDDVIAHPYFEKAQMMNTDLLTQFPVQMPEQEMGYLIANLVSLLNATSAP